MDIDKISEIVELLAKKTQKKQVKWETSNIDDAYQVSFANYSVIIQKRPVSAAATMLAAQKNSKPSRFLISILDWKGEVVEEVSDLNLEITDAQKVVSDLYQEARRSAKGVDEALDNILKALKGD